MPRAVGLAPLAFAFACTSAAPPRSAAHGEAADPPADAPVAAAADAPSSAPDDIDAARGGLVITNFVPGTFVIESDTAVALQSRARIERLGIDGGWVALETLDLGAGYTLRAGCGQPLPACTELAADAPLVPVPLSGMSCASQCNAACKKNAWLGPAQLRLSIDRCDGGTLVGPPFRLGPVAGDEHVQRRWGAAQDIVRGSIVRLHDVDVAAERKSRGPRLLERRVRAETQRELEPAQLAELVALLEAPQGYDDLVARRCRMDHLVGFTLVREPATTGTPVPDTLEIAIDFVCRRISFAHGGHDGLPRVEDSSYFDPTHARWLALVRAALPDDRELARLE